MDNTERKRPIGIWAITVLNSLFAIGLLGLICLSFFASESQSLEYQDGRSALRAPLALLLFAMLPSTHLAWSGNRAGRNVMLVLLSIFFCGVIFLGGADIIWGFFFAKIQSFNWRILLEIVLAASALGGEIWYFCQTRLEKILLLRLDVIQGDQIGVGLSPAGKSKLLVSHVVHEMTRPGAAGVIRAVTKLATFRPDAAKTLRNIAIRLAIAPLQCLKRPAQKRFPQYCPRCGASCAGQYTDAILQQKPAPMSAGSDRMKSALTNIFLGYLGFSKKAKWARTEAEDDEGPIDSEIFDEPPASEGTRYDPIEQGFRRTKAPRKSKTRPSMTTPKDATPPVRTPPKAPNSPASLPRRRSRRKRRTV